MKLTKVITTAIALLVSIANADVIVTKDGSSINGKILGIDGGIVTVSTDFAGELEIKQDQIDSLSTDEPIYLTVEGGTTYLGPVSGDSNGLTISSQDGTLSTEVAKVEESWQPGSESPSAKRQAERMKNLDRKWTYEAAFDMTGKSGNRDSTGIGTAFRAILKGNDDKLEFFAQANFEETDNLKSADEARGGVEYSNNFGGHYKWYVRSEFGFDAIKDIDTSFTTAGGLGYIFSDTERRQLSVRGGLGYLFESYGDPLREETSSASLDLGLSHVEKYKWGTWVNRATFTPTIEDLGNFRFSYDTSVDLPLKSGNWSTRVGISNTYDSEADLSDKKELDTTYYIRMVLKWL